jgi:hypothetical protein
VRTTMTEHPKPADDPAAGRIDLELPGADRPDPQPDPPSDPQDDLPERLGRRIGEPDGGVASGEPDLLPNVETPDASM